MQLISLEGNRQQLDGGAMFGNAPKSLWQKWIVPDALNRIPLACRCFLLITDEGKKILFETGIGNFFDAKLKERYGVVENEHLLLKNLALKGIAHQDIDYVVLSHLHFDHAGGLLLRENEELTLLFPNAKYCVGEEQWMYAQNPHSREKASFIPEMLVLLKKSKRLLLINEETQDDLGPNLTFRFSYGHTIGMMLTEIRLNKRLYVFVADLIPGMPWTHLPITMGYDRFPTLTVDEKTQFYQDWANRSATLLFTHDHEVSCATLVIDEQGNYKCYASNLN